MIVAGIDPSLTSAGIAVLRDGRPVLLTSVGHESNNAKSWEHRERRIVSQSRAITRALEPHKPIDLVAIEAPLTFAGGPNTGDSYDRYTVFILVLNALRMWHVPYAAVHNQTRSLWATGKGGSKKRVVLDAVRETWAPWASHIRNDDIADALTLAEMCARAIAEELHFPLRRRHIVALPGIAWPEGAKGA